MTDKVTDSIIVKGPVEEIYDIWSDFTTFPQFMENIESVTPKDGDETHWVMKGLANTTFEWDALATRMEENSRIAWKSVGGDVKVSGQVTFKELPKDQVQVTVTLQYVPPGGVIGKAAASLFAQPEDRLKEDLHNFKRYVEQSDEVATSSN